MIHLTTKEKIKYIFSNNPIKTLPQIMKWALLVPQYIYNKFWKMARKISQNSIFIRKSEIYMCSLFPKKILDAIITEFKPKTILDLGCGTGKSLDYFVSKNIKVMGVEGSSLAIKQSSNPKLIKKFNLNNELNLNQKFDLIWSFEFVEHIHQNYLDNLMKTFTNHSDSIIISAARPGQGGEGHFNEQNDEYWITQFKKYNYKLDEINTKKLRLIDEQFSKNMYVFKIN